MRVSLAFSLLSALLISCGDDDHDGPADSNLRWECFEDSSFGECECYGLRPGESITVDGDGEGAIKQIPSCDGYATCFNYMDEILDAVCSCGDTNFTPFGEVTELESVSSCPE